MKILLTVLAIGWLTTPYVWAQDDPHAGHHPPPAGQAAGDATRQAEGHDPAATGSQHDHEKAGGKLQENMKQMQALMARMQQTTDAAQRRALLGEHLQLMREQLKLMLAAGHAHGSEAGAGAPGAAQKEHGAQPSQGSGADDKKKCAMMEGGKCKMMENEKDGGMMAGGMMGGGMMMMHEKMEQRVQMLEQLLGQMVEREAVEHELESR